MAGAGDLDLVETARPYPKMRILSVSEILEGKRFETPTSMGRTQTAQKGLANMITKRYTIPLKTGDDYIATGTDPNRPPSSV